MPFNISGVYTPAAGATTAAAGDIIHSATWNAIFTDISSALTTVKQQVTIATVPETEVKVVADAADSYLTAKRGLQLINYNSDCIDVERYGAIGDGLNSSATVNAQAFVDAVAALGSNGGKILIPYGRYHTNGPLANLLDKSGIEFVGVGSGNGQTGTVGSSEIVYTATTGPLIRLDGTHAITFRNLTLSYNSASYVANNVLINLRKVSGSRMTFGTLFEDCSIGGWNTSAKNALLIDVGKTIWTTIKRGYIRNAFYGVVGARSGGDSTNVTVIEGTEFDRDMRLAVLIGGTSWRLRSVIGEPIRGTTGGVALTFFAISPLGVTNVSISGCSLEDGAVNTGSWLNFNLATDFGAQGAIAGLSIIGNYIAAGEGFVLDFGSAGCRGGIISGNAFNDSSLGLTGFIQNASNASDMIIVGNNANTNAGPGSGIMFVSGSFPTGSSIIDNNDGKGVRYHTNRVKTVATLPAASGLRGERFMVTDATASTFATIVAGTGGNGVPVFSDGTDWRIG